MPYAAYTDSLFESTVTLGRNGVTVNGFAGATVNGEYKQALSKIAVTANQMKILFMGLPSPVRAILFVPIIGPNDQQKSQAQCPTRYHLATTGTSRRAVPAYSG